MCRREGMKLYLKGEKCYTEKCPVHKRPVPPGMHAKSRRKPSEFSVRLREKQKLRRIYGVLETQFKTYFRQAAKAKGVTGVRLLQLLGSGRFPAGWSSTPPRWKGASWRCRRGKRSTCRLRSN